MRTSDPKKEVIVIVHVIHKGNILCVGASASETLGPSGHLHGPGSSPRIDKTLGQASLLAWDGQDGPLA